jgi:hypothetical protein
MRGKKSVPAVGFSIQRELIEVAEQNQMVTEAAAKIVTSVPEVIDYGRLLGFKNIAMANFVSQSIFDVVGEFGVAGLQGMTDKQVSTYLLGHFVVFIEAYIRKHAATVPEQAVRWMHGKLQQRAVAAAIDLDSFMKAAGIQQAKPEQTSDVLDSETLQLLERTFNRETEKCSCGLDGMLTLQKTNNAIKIYHEKGPSGNMAYHVVKTLTPEQFKEAKVLEKQHKNRQKVAQNTKKEIVTALQNGNT